MPFPDPPHLAPLPPRPAPASSHRRQPHNHNHTHTHDRKPSRPETPPPPYRRMRIHTLLLATSTTSITLLALAIPIWNANFYHPSAPHLGDWADGLPLLPLSISILITLHHLLSLLLYHQPLWTPTFRGALLPHVLLLLLLPPALTFTLTNSLINLYRSPTPSASGTVLCTNMANLFSPQCQPTLYTIGSLQLGGIITGFTSSFLHFVLMVLNCADLRRRRREKKATKDRRRREFYQWYAAETKGDMDYEKYDRGIYASRATKSGRARDRDQKGKWADVMVTIEEV